MPQRTYIAIDLKSFYASVECVERGLDALTTDEVRSLLEAYGNLYTQIKIDEVTNLGAIKIRLRSLIAAIEQQKKEEGNE